MNNDGNMILTEELVLQDEAIWKKFFFQNVIPENNHFDLYFEERNLEVVVQKRETYFPDVRYVNRLIASSWGQKVIRFYDLDGNLIEAGMPM